MRPGGHSGKTRAADNWATQESKMPTTIAKPPAWSVCEPVGSESRTSWPDGNSFASRRQPQPCGDDRTSALSDTETNSRDWPQQHGGRSATRCADEQQSDAPTDRIWQPSGHGPRSQQSHAAADAKDPNAKSAAWRHRKILLGMKFIAFAPDDHDTCLLLKATHLAPRKARPNNPTSRIELTLSIRSDAIPSRPACGGFWHLLAGQNPPGTRTGWKDRLLLVRFRTGGAKLLHELLVLREGR